MFNKLRIYLNILLCRFGIRDILPKEAIRKVRILENHDQIVDISEDDSFFFDTSLSFPAYVRNEVYHKLRQAVGMLPEGIYLKIYDAYRPIEKQRESWEEALEQTKKEKSDLLREEIQRLTSLKVADPHNAGRYGGHQTGGALDVILCDRNGEELDLGTKVGEHNEKTKTENPFLSKDAKRNRKILNEVMTTVGFRNFPGEWWHFSYGDQLWAAYSGNKICFYGFVAEPSKPIIKRGNIADGLNDIAKHLGLNPEKTIFIHSISDPKGKIEINPPIHRHAQVLSYLPRKSKGAKALMLYVLPDLLNYLDEQGIASKKNFIQINTKPPEIFAYPDISVAAQFHKAVRDGRQIIIDILRGKTLISSYPGRDEQLLAESADMKLLIHPAKQLEFNSKSRLRLKAVEYGYNILPGIEINNLDEFDRKILRLKKIIDDHALNINTVKLWSKFDAQSDGKGILIFEGLTDDNIRNLKQHFCSFKDTSKLFPLVVEIDANYLKDVKVVGNIGVEAVVADNTITLVGSVMQNTLNGRYIGSMITPDLEKYEITAEATTIPVFVGLQREGYRGIATIDVLVAYNSKSRSYIGYNIDPNARFSAGMQLLSIVQYIRKITGRKYYGISCFNSIKDSNSLFQDIKNYTSPYLYDGKRSEYEGVLPLLVNDLTKTKDNKRVVQVAVVGRDMLRINKMYKHFKDNIIKTLSSG